MESCRNVRRLTALATSLFSLSISYHRVLVRADDTLNGVVTETFGKKVSVYGCFTLSRALRNVHARLGTTVVT